MIHETAIIGPEVVLGANVQVGAYSVITGTVIIGDRVTIHAHASIGDTPQHRRFYSDGTLVQIGDGTIVREFATIHAGTQRVTKIGRDCYLMSYSHVSHDTQLEDGVTLANSVQIGGHCTILKGANLGLGALVHQYQIVGAYSMVGMGCVATSKSRIEPGCTYFGNPARMIGINHIGLERAGIDEETLAEEVERWERLVAGKNGSF